MTRSPGLTWLHFSDLHCGAAAGRRDWPTVRDALWRDLERMHEIAGAPDLVLFTGDLAWSGDVAEYDEVGAFLDELDGKLGRKLPVFAVPGNHDLRRPIGEEERRLAWLESGARNELRREELWSPGSSLRGPLEAMFARWLDFVDSRLLPRFESAATVKGLVPGDWKTTLELDGFRLGLIGINSAWRQFAAGDFRGQLSVDPRQVDRLVDGKKEAFKRSNHLTLLLQHHPPDWLEDFEQWQSHVEVAAHVVLFGHEHENAAVTQRRESNYERARVQAASLCGIEHYLDSGGRQEERRFGYRWGRARLDGRGDDRAVDVWTWARALNDRRKRWDFVHPADCEYEEREGMRYGPFPVEVERPRVAPIATDRGSSTTGDQPPDVDASVRGYLDATARQFRTLRITVFDELRRIEVPLERAYVRLSAHAMGYEERLARGGSDDRKTGGDGGAMRSDPVDLEGALRLAERREHGLGLAMLGEPGHGKSTTLRWLFRQVVQHGSASLGLPSDLTPIFLRLSRVEADDLAPDGLARLVQRELADQRFEAAGEDLVRTRRPMLFLLDGLDEAEARSREGFAGRLTDELERWPESSRAVVTCRFAAYAEVPLLSNRFLRADLQWLGDDQVRAFVRQWFDAVLPAIGESAADAKAKAEALADKLLDPANVTRHGLREITGIPLLLSNLCRFHHKHGRLPDARAELYDASLKLLLEVWVKERGGVAVLSDGAAREILQPLAWEMQLRGATSLSADEIAAIVAKPLSELRDVRLTPAEFLRAARDSSGVLAVCGRDSFEFLHKTFREYLAAMHAVTRALYGDLVARMGQADWRETILLALASSGACAPFLRAAIARKQLAAHVDLLRECLAQPRAVDLAPLREALHPSGDPGELAAILKLLQSRSDAETEQRARALVDHDDAAVRQLAREVARFQTVVLSHAGDDSVPYPEPVDGATWTWQRLGIAFVGVSAGEFLMGSSKTKGEPGYDPEAWDDELPAHRVRLTRGFWIARHPITNTVYGEYVRATGAREPAYWRDRRFNQPEQPVVGIDWKEALAFCAWLTHSDGGALDWTVDLPTEAEWERAARGTDARKYPWGNVPEPDAAQAHFGRDFSSDGPASIGGRPDGASPVGAHDMAGNVWEWCRDAWREGYGSARGTRVDPMHDPAAAGSVARVVRGGSWWGVPRYLRCATRGRFGPADRGGGLGFRVVCLRSPEHVA